MRTDLAGGDPESFVAEPVACEDVDSAHDADDDAGGDDDTPEGGTKGVFGGSRFVKVTEDRDAEDNHEDAQGDEAGAGGEEGPVCCRVALEETDFGN